MSTGEFGHMIFGIEPYGPTLWLLHASNGIEVERTGSLFGDGTVDVLANDDLTVGNTKRSASHIHQNC